MKQNERGLIRPVPLAICDRPVQIDGAKRRKVQGHRGPAYPPPGGGLFGTLREALHKTSMPSELYFSGTSPYHDSRTAGAFAHGDLRTSARFVTNQGTTPSSRRPVTLRAAAARLRGG